MLSTCVHADARIDVGYHSWLQVLEERKKVVPTFLRLRPMLAMQGHEQPRKCHKLSSSQTVQGSGQWFSIWKKRRWVSQINRKRRRNQRCRYAVMIPGLGLLRYLATPLCRPSPICWTPRWRLFNAINVEVWPCRYSNHASNTYVVFFCKPIPNYVFGP